MACDIHAFWWDSTLKSGMSLHCRNQTHEHIHIRYRLYMLWKYTMESCSYICLCNWSILFKSKVSLIVGIYIPK